MITCNTRFAIRSRAFRAPRCLLRLEASTAQLMVYVDPLKLQAHELSPMDVVRATNSLESDLAGRRCAHRADGLQHLYQRAGAQRAGPQRHAPQDRRPEIGVCFRRWPCRGRLGVAVQHRSRGRPEIRLRRRAEAGRRHQHDRRGQRNQESHPELFAIFPRNSRPAWFSISRCSSRKPFPRCCAKAASEFFSPAS